MSSGKSARSREDPARRRRTVSAWGRLRNPVRRMRARCKASSVVIATCIIHVSGARVKYTRRPSPLPRWRIGQTGVVWDPDLTALAGRAATGLRERGETVAVAESSGGGLISATLLSIPGASAYYAGGAVIYTLAASRAFLAGAIPTPAGLRGETEEFALYLARSAARKLEADWGIGESGAAGPSGSPYGDPRRSRVGGGQRPEGVDPAPPDGVDGPCRQHGHVREDRPGVARSPARDTRLTAEGVHRTAPERAAPHRNGARREEAPRTGR